MGNGLASPEECCVYWHEDDVLLTNRLVCQEVSRETEVVKQELMVQRLWLIFLRSLLIT